jgi:hypothetical protein
MAEVCFLEAVNRCLKGSRYRMKFTVEGKGTGAVEVVVWDDARSSGTVIELKPEHVKGLLAFLPIAAKSTSTFTVECDEAPNATE